VKGTFVKQHKESEQARLSALIDKFLFSNIDFYNGKKFSKMIAHRNVVTEAEKIFSIFNKA
jgi:hypothetical protein